MNNNDPKIIIGRVVAVNGTTPGPASGISYSIVASIPDTGPVRMDNQKPARRWPDELWIEAVPTTRGKNLVFGIWEASVLTWHFLEFPSFADCPSTNAQSRALKLLASVGGSGVLTVPGILPDTDVGTSGGGTAGNDFNGFNPD
jgi:hypothetical protein